MTRRKKIFFLLALLTAVLLLSSAATDEPDDLGHYGPPGQLLESLDPCNGHKPTLYERCSNNARNFDYKGHNMLDLKDNLTDGLLNGGTSFFDNLNRIMVDTSIDPYITVSSFDVIPIDEEVEVVLSSARGSILDWFPPSALVLGRIGVLTGLTCGTGDGLDQIGAIATCVIFTISVVKVPGA